MSCCTSAGLTATSIVYVGYASSSSGANFSLGTPLASSRYVAFVSVLSTASVPTAASFAGKWTSLYGTGIFNNNYTAAATSATTNTVLNVVATPVYFWAINDVCKLTSHYTANNVNANSKSIPITFLSRGLYAINFTDIANTKYITVIYTISRVTATYLMFTVQIQYKDTSNIVLQTTELQFTPVSCDNTDSVVSTISFNGICADGADTITLNSSIVELIRS